MDAHFGLRHKKGLFECHLFSSDDPASRQQTPLWKSVNIVIFHKGPDSGLDLSETPNGCNEIFRSLDDLDAVALAFMLGLLESASKSPGGAAKIVVPRVSGYIIRADIIPLRVRDCPRVIDAVSFAQPGQWFSGDYPPEADYNLADLFRCAVGGIVMEPCQTLFDMTTDLQVLEHELMNRLSFPWLLKNSHTRPTLVFVGNYLRYPGYGGTGVNHYSCAKALGIDMIVLDRSGCWIEDDKYADLRKAFIPCDLTRDDKLDERLVEALSPFRGKLDGIVSFHESLQVGVAMAAQSLSLPTLDATALGAAADKYRTSQIDGHVGFLATSAADAIDLLSQPRLSFPLILKPCRGWGSEGVYQATNRDEFLTAVHEIGLHTGQHGSRFLIEEYCDGPEFDINIVLCDGEILFHEISDDFPKRGDGRSTQSPMTFLELDMGYPSTLPAAESDMLCRSVHRALLEMGLHSGIFHVEARVKHSTVCYQRQSDGMIDLGPSHPVVNDAPDPKCFLIEINARPPGITVTESVERMYGIDYIGLGLLFGLNDKDRIRALCQPFQRGPQYWCQTVFIPVEQEGRFECDDVCDELRHRRPDLARHIVNGVCYWRRGDMIPSSTYMPWIAHFLVSSRLSRAHLVRVSNSIRDAVRISIVPQ